jgi:hypothetical protein
MEPGTRASRTSKILSSGDMIPTDSIKPANQLNTCHSRAYPLRGTSSGNPCFLSPLVGESGSKSRERGINLHAGTRPGGRLTFLLVQESKQRSTPRFAGPSGYPRSKGSPGRCRKLAFGVGQRPRTSPASPSSLGGAEGIYPCYLDDRAISLLRR